MKYKTTIKSGSGRRLGAGILVLTGMLLLSGCMTLSDGRELQEEVVQLQERQTELEADAEVREQTLADMIEEVRAEIIELESVMEDARKILARDSADLEAELASARRRIGEVQGRLEELQYEQRRFSETFENFRQDMDTRFEGIEPEELLEMVQDFKERGEIDWARRALDQFLSEYGDHEMAWEARLELGELYFSSGQFDSAAPYFQELLRDPNSEARQARAARRIGEISMSRGNCDDAKVFFEVVVEDYSASDEVADAQRFLRDIEQGECR